jgi:hypothetical protein
MEESGRITRLGVCIVEKSTNEAKREGKLEARAAIEDLDQS